MSKPSRKSEKQKPNKQRGQLGGGQNHRENKKKQRSWGNQLRQGPGRLPFCPKSLFFFLFFFVFSMVLASSQLGPLFFFGFSGFLNGFASNSPTWFGWCAESFSHRFPDVYMFPHVKGLGTFIFICFGCCDCLIVFEESYKTVVGETRVQKMLAPRTKD